ncbi:ribosome silencing factor [Rapidithrix thailandica]|uniref:Ribosomal silencing factor RsfS n=1 Tax=Rapidithrix thailandica TaxID=413964 RepID=A0AAW9SHE9_9BACT
MIKQVKEVDSKELAEAIIFGMQEKKAQDVVVMDLRKIKNAIADYFVICSGSSDTQVQALASSVEEQVYKKHQEDPWKKEGVSNCEWVLLDYVDVVVHIFLKDKRQFYGLEELWGDAEIISLENK